jgi:hypothetical protein
MYSNPAMFKHGLTKGKIQQELVEKFKKELDMDIHIPQLRNKMNYMEQQFRAARILINQTGQDDLSGSTLNNRVEKVCPFYF